MMFDEILKELGLTYEEYEKIFSEFQETAAQSEGPIATVDNWNNHKSREQRIAFLKGMVFSYFLKKVAEVDMSEIIQ